MLKSNNGYVEIYGTKIQLLTELVCIMRAFVKDGIASQEELDELVKYAQKDIEDIKKEVEQLEKDIRQRVENWLDALFDDINKEKE